MFRWLIGPHWTIGIVPRGTIEASVTGVDGICEEYRWLFKVVSGKYRANSPAGYT
jgi:hypothetical protein